MAQEAEGAAAPAESAAQPQSADAPATDSSEATTPGASLPGTDTEGDPSSDGTEVLDPDSGQEAADPTTEVEGAVTPEEGEAEATDPEAKPEESEEVAINEPQALLEGGEGEGGSGALGAPTSERARVDDADGSLGYSVVLPIPPGRLGMQPDLRLSYDSGNRDNHSFVGYGWSLSIPYIQRLNRKGVNKLYSESDYISSIDGELTLVSGSTYRPKVENGSFRTYTLSSNVWTVTDKQGTIFSFGSTTQARQDNASNTAQVYKWMLESARDLNANSVDYTYYKHEGEIYPDTITYTNNAGSGGIFTINFARESRDDDLVSYAPGFSVHTAYRLDRIHVKVNGTLVRQYDLTFAAGYNTARTLLSTLVTSGSDGSATSTLPAMRFLYSGAGDWTEDGDWATPEPFTNSSGADQGTRIADVNGDALPDLLRSFDASGTTSDVSKVYLNDGLGWTYSASWSIPTATRPAFVVSGSRDQGYRVLDVNGDGKSDILSFYEGDAKKAFINTGAGWSDDSTWHLPDATPIAVDDTSSGDYGVRFGDITGDGLPDIVQSSYISSQDLRGVYLNTGAGWEAASTSWQVPEWFIATNNDQGTRLEDVNGDGLADIIRSFNDTAGTPTSTSRVYLNTGSNWELNNVWSPPDWIVHNTTEHSRFMDFNGDGLTDLLKHIDDDDPEISQKAYMNTGDGWVHETGLDIPDTIQYGAKGDETGVRFSDVDGDNMVDILKNGKQWGGGTSEHYYIHNGEVADLLEVIEDSTGGTTTITYTQTADTYEGTDVRNPSLPYSLDVVETITYDDGFNAEGETLYEFAGGEQYYVGPFERKFAGFATTTVTDPAGNVTVSYGHQGNSTLSSIGEYLDSVAKIGKSYLIEKFDAVSNLFSRIINRWDEYSITASSSFVKLTRTLDMQYDGDSDHKDTATEFSFEDTTGNLLGKTEWGEVTGSTNGSFSDTGSDKRTTVNTYASSSPAGISGLLARSTLTNQSSSTLAETRNYYDLQSLGSATLGNLTKQERWASSTAYIDIERTYNGYGLVTQEKDPRDKTTTYTYDTYNLYPATTTNALSHNVYAEYDYSSGKVSRKIDENSREYQWTFDGLDRLTGELQPDLTTPSTLVTRASYIYTTTTTPQSVRKTDHLDASNLIDTYTYFDGFGRVLQTRREGEASNTFTVTDRALDARGLLSRASLPYYASSSAYAAATTTGALFTNQTYDALMRVKAVGNAAGTTTTAYDQWKTMVLDANSHPKTLYSDAFKNLIQVDENDGNGTSSTQYTYDALNNLTSITDALSNIRNFTYDGLSRRTSAQDLHASGDTTFGTWTYGYDAAGNLSSSTDPKGQVVNSTYDDLNRLLTENYTGQSGTEKTYTYDNGTDGIGKLYSAIASSSASSSYAYNALGLLKTETRVIPGNGSYVTSYEYDRAGNRTNITYPDSAQTRYTFNGGGVAETVERKEASDGGFSYVVSNLNYAPTGAITTVSFANSVTTTNTYDQSKLYRLQSKVTTLPSSAQAQNLAYTYDNVGNILTITDTSNTKTAKTVTYTYDWLNRLLTASSTGATTSPNYLQAFSYNALGNILSGPVGSYSYTGNTGSSYANPHAATAIATSTGTGVSTSTIALDATSTSISTGFASCPCVKTWTHTVTGDSPIIVLTADIWQDVGGTGSITSATWNGGAFTKVGSTRSVGIATEVWYLVATTTGSKTISVTVTGATDAIKLGASSFTGVSATAPLDATSTATGTNGNPSASITTGAASDVVVSTLNRFSTTDATSSKSALYKDRVTSTLGAGSYQLATTPGSYSDTYTGSVTNDWSMVMAAFRPATTTSAATTSTSTYAYDQNGNLTSKADPNLSGATYTQYDDFLGYGWTSAGWSSTADFAYTATTSEGFNSIRNTYTGAWGALALYNFNGVQTTPYSNLKFSINRGTSTAPDLYVRFYQGESWTPVGSAVALSSYVSSLATSTWYDVTIPLSAFSATNTTINVVSFENANTGTLNFDNVRLQAATGATTSYAWTYDNRLASTSIGSALTTYRYDHQGQRVLLGEAAGTTTIPNELYSTKSGTTTKNIYVGDLLLATVDGSNGSSTLHYTHADHLGGANVVTTSGGALEETLDYYPYGAIRIDHQTTRFDQRRKYIGQEFDETTGLNYLNARYQDGEEGRFISQDPMHLSIGDRRFAQQYGNSLKGHIANPQRLNSYSYSLNNPITMLDPVGEDSYYFWQSLREANRRTNGWLGERFSSEGKGIASAGKVAVGAIAVTTVAALAPSAATFSAAASVGARAYADLRDGSIDDSGKQYAGSYVIGGIGGKVAGPNPSVPEAAVIGMVTAAVDNLAIDNNTNPQEPVATGISTALVQVGAQMMGYSGEGAASPRFLGTTQLAGTVLVIAINEVVEEAKNAWRQRHNKE